MNSSIFIVVHNTSFIKKMQSNFRQYCFIETLIAEQSCRFLNIKDFDSFSEDLNGLDLMEPIKKLQPNLKFLKNIKGYIIDLQKQISSA